MKFTNLIQHPNGFIRKPMLILLLLIFPALLSIAIFRMVREEFQSSDLLRSFGRDFKRVWGGERLFR